MKNFTYQLSESDIQTILSTLIVMLEILPHLDLEELPPDTVSSALLYGKSAMNRLSCMSHKITNNELSAIHISLQLADMINHEEVDVDEVSSDLCHKNIFVINKLLSVFDDYFEQ